MFFVLDLIGNNNLIRHSKNVDILYKLLRLLEDREQIITNRNTKTNFLITNSVDQPLTVMWIAMHLPVNATTFVNTMDTQIVSDAAERAGKHGADLRNQWLFSGAVTESFELG